MIHSYDQILAIQDEVPRFVHDICYVTATTWPSMGAYFDSAV